MQDTWIIILALLGVVVIAGIAMAFSLSHHEKKLAKVKKKGKKGKMRLPQSRTPGK